MFSQKLSRFLRIVSIGVLLSLIINVLCAFSFQTKANTNRYCGYGDSVMPYAAVTTETVNYTSREVSIVEIPKGVPSYSQLSYLENSCGPTAGAIVVGYYDKTYENLIPNYKPCLSSGTFLGKDKVYIPQLMSELYTLMRTNVDDVGVNESDCLSGLRTYVKNHGYSISYTNAKSGNTVSESVCTNGLNNLQPTLLFCRKMDLYLVSQNADETQDKLVVSAYTGGHVVVAHAIYTVKYYNGTNNFRTDKYLNVATGMQEMSSGFIKLSSTDWCNAAYVVSIS